MFCKLYALLSIHWHWCWREQEKVIKSLICVGTIPPYSRIHRISKRPHINRNTDTHHPHPTFRLYRTERVIVCTVHKVPYAFYYFNWWCLALYNAKQIKIACAPIHYNHFCSVFFFSYVRFSFAWVIRSLIRAIKTLCLLLNLSKYRS